MRDPFANYDQWLLRGCDAGFDDPNDHDDTDDFRDVEVERD